MMTMPTLWDQIAEEGRGLESRQIASSMSLTQIAIISSPSLPYPSSRTSYEKERESGQRGDGGCCHERRRETNPDPERAAVGSARDIGRGRPSFNGMKVCGRHGGSKHIFLSSR
jgi:hypothetical protein